MTPSGSRSANLAREFVAGVRGMLLDFFENGAAVSQKPDNTPVTEADIAIESRIREQLHSAFPDDAFYGEETGRRDGNNRRLWLLDPIDGTKSFVRGHGFFSTQLALMESAQLVLGVSMAPVFDELYWAEKGVGAWCGTQRLRVSATPDLARAHLSVGNLTSLAGSSRWQRFGQLLMRVDRHRGYGDFFHYHLLASGKLDVVVESDVNILDIAALTVIVREAGGKVTDLSGQAIGLDTRSIVASNGLLHDAVLESVT